MNLKQEVVNYLDKHPTAKMEELRKAFPEASKKSLWNYSGQWKRERGIQPTAQEESVRKKVFDFFDKHPDATLADLRKVLPMANRVSISNYRYQWKKQKPPRVKKQSVKNLVFTYLNKNPDSTFKELRHGLPDINPSSISAYHSLWKKENGYQLSRDRYNATLSKADRDIIQALQTTIDAQKETIEAMKLQNELLREDQSGAFSTLGELSDEEREEVKHVLSTFIKGLKGSNT